MERDKLEGRLQSAKKDSVFSLGCKRHCGALEMLRRMLAALAYLHLLPSTSLIPYGDSHSASTPLACHSPPFLPVD